MKKALSFKRKTESFDQQQLSMLLKNKRLEQKKKLEDVAKGICSPSYLSRLENNHIKLQEPYLKMLFEKLDIDYDKLKSERRTNVFIDLLKYQKTNQIEKYEEFIKEVIDSKCYLGIERDLILLFVNLNNKFYEESLIIIDKVEENVIHLSNLQICFFMFLLTRFYYETNRLQDAFKQIKVLSKTIIENPILKWCVESLKIELLFDCGEFVDCSLSIKDFISNAPIDYFQKDIIKHRIKLLTILSLNDFESSKIGLDELFEDYNCDESLERDFKYHMALMHYFHKDFNMVIICLRESLLDYKMICLIGLSMEFVDNDLKEYAFNVVNNYKFSKYEQLFKNFCYYEMMKNHSAQNTWLLNYLKQNVYNMLKHTFWDVLYHKVIKDLIFLCSKCSKHKEAMRLSLNYIDSIDKEFLK